MVHIFIIHLFVSLNKKFCKDDEAIKEPYSCLNGSKDCNGEIPVTRAIEN